MFQELRNYTDKDHFFFEADNDLEKVCNAPKDKGGVLKIVIPPPICAIVTGMYEFDNLNLGINFYGF
jgi:hypothetical protein